MGDVDGIVDAMRPDLASSRGESGKDADYSWRPHPLRPGVAGFGVLGARAMQMGLEETAGISNGTVTGGVLFSSFVLHSSFPLSSSIQLGRSLL